jgi:integrase
VSPNKKGEQAMKSKTGYVYKDKQKGKWCARVSYTDESGKRKSFRRFFDSKTDAKDQLPELLTQIKDHGTRSVKGENLTISELVDLYEGDHVKPAKMRNGQKVSGLKGYETIGRHCQVLKDFFGSKSVREFRASDLERFKENRLSVPKQRGGGERSLASVNRELEVLRAVFNFAKREGWLIASPFEKTKGIIKKSAEQKRFRTLSPDEEARLLAACTDKREHLKAILIFLLDTGARRGEAFGLKWREVNFEKREITIHAGKTDTTRKVPMTNRLYFELQTLWSYSGKLNGLVFSGIGTVKRSLATACRLAEIEGFRLHDSRHSFVSRLVRQGLSLVEVMRLSGHSTLSAFSTYANELSDTTERGTNALNFFHEQNNVLIESDRIN